MTAGTRFRLVTHQGDETHVGATVLAPDEVGPMLKMEARMHYAAGWHVDARPSRLSLRRQGIVRVIEACAFSPFEDVIGEPEAPVSLPPGCRWVDGQVLYSAAWLDSHERGGEQE